MLEREVKLGAPQGFALPELTRVTADVADAQTSIEKLNTTYYDTRDLRLTRWGCSLRFRAGQGWTVKLPGPQAPNGTLLVRGEHVFEGEPKSPPSQALDLLAAYLRRSAVHPVARLRTTRKMIVLKGADGTPLAEAVHDDVAVLDGRKIAARFREVEVELRESAPEDLLDAILERLQAAGAGMVDPTPKVARALGTRAARPRRSR